MPSLARLLSSGVLAFALLGCGSSTELSSPGAASPRAEASHAQVAWRSKCSGCHVPVEPGTHTREALAVALDRHRKRVRLSEGEWAEMVDFLARPSASSRASNDAASPL